MILAENCPFARRELLDTENSVDGQTPYLVFHAPLGWTMMLQGFGLGVAMM